MYATSRLMSDPLSEHAALTPPPWQRRAALTHRFATLAARSSRPPAGADVTDELAGNKPDRYQLATTADKTRM